MKKLAVKILSLMVAVTAVFGLAGLTSNYAKATTAISGFSIDNGASISENSRGMRFSTTVTYSAYKQIMDEAQGKEVVFGTTLTLLGETDAVLDICYTTTNPDAIVPGSDLKNVISFDEDSDDDDVYNYYASLVVDEASYVKYLEENVTGYTPALKEQYISLLYSTPFVAKSYYMIIDDTENRANNTKNFCENSVTRSISSSVYVWAYNNKVGETLRSEFIKKYLLEEVNLDVYYSVEGSEVKFAGFDFEESKITRVTNYETAENLNGVQININKYDINDFQATYNVTEQLFIGNEQNGTFYAYSIDGKVYKVNYTKTDKIIKDVEDFKDVFEVKEGVIVEDEVMLANDLDFTGVTLNHFASETANSAGFKGVFNGLGHVLKNFDTTNADGKGIFGYFLPGATVKNFALTITDASKAYLASINDKSSAADGSNLEKYYVNDVFVYITQQNAVIKGISNAVFTSKFKTNNFVVYYPFSYLDTPATSEKYIYDTTGGAESGLISKTGYGIDSEMNTFVIGDYPLTWQSPNNVGSINNINRLRFAENDVEAPDYILLRKIDKTDPENPVIRKLLVSEIVGGGILDDDISDEERGVILVDKNGEPILENGEYVYAGKSSSANIDRYVNVRQYKTFGDMAKAEQDNTAQSGRFRLDQFNSEYWTITNGIPLFNALKEVVFADAVECKVVKEDDEFTTIKDTDTYSIVLKDVLGEDISDFEISIDESVFTVDNAAHTITLKALPEDISAYQYQMRITFTQNDTLYTFVKIVTVQNNTTAISGEYYYDVTNEKFFFTDSGIANDVETIYYANANGQIKNLGYDKATNKLTAIKSVTANFGTSKFTGITFQDFTGLTVTIVGSGYTDSVLLSATDNYLTKALKAYAVTTNGDYYSFDLIPATKVVTSATEIGYIGNNTPTGFVNSLELVKYDAGSYVILGGDIDLSGYNIPRAFTASGSEGDSVVFDGRGHSISNVTIDQDYSGLFGMRPSQNAKSSILSNFALLNAKVLHDMSGIIANSLYASIISNAYIQISADSAGNGLQQASIGGGQVALYHVVVDDLRAEDEANTIFSSSIVMPNGLINSYGVYVISNNYLGKSGENFVDAHNNSASETTGVVYGNTPGNMGSHDYYRFTSFGDLKTRLTSHPEFDSTMWIWDNEGDNIPLWKNAAEYIKASHTVVTVSDGTEDYVFGSVLDNNKTYTITSFVDYLGVDILASGDPTFEFSYDPEDANRFTFGENTFKVNELPSDVNTYSYEISAIVTVGEVVKTIVIPVKIQTPQIDDTATKTYYYSVADNKLYTDFANDITELYYVDAQDVKHQLTYNAQTGSIPAITGVETIGDASGYYVFGFYGVKVTINETIDSYANTVTLNATQGTNLYSYVDQALTFYALTDSAIYTFNVIPATKVVTTTAQVEAGALDFANYNAKDYVVLGSDIDLEGVTIPASNANATPYAVTFDGRGFSIKNANVTADNSGLFGKVIGKSAAFTDWSVIANVALINAKATNATAGVLAYNLAYTVLSNTYVQIATDSNSNGLNVSQLTTNMLNSYNTVIDDLRTYDATNTVFAPKINDGRAFNYVRLIVVVSENRFGYWNATRYYEANNKYDSNDETPIDITAPQSGSFGAYRYDDYVDFKVGYTDPGIAFNNNFGTYSDLWSLADGMPIWASEADAITSARSTVTVSDGESAYEYGTVLVPNKTYTIESIVDYLGNNLIDGDASFEFSVEPNDADVFTFTENTFKVNRVPVSLEALSYTISVTVTANDLVRTLEIPVKVETPEYDDTATKTYYYSVADKKLYTDFANDITELYYVDAQSVKHQLTYNTTDGIPALSVEAVGDSSGQYVFGFYGVKVTINETIDSYSNTVTLNATRKKTGTNVDYNSFVDQVMTFYALTDSAIYTFNVIPATKVVTTSAQVEAGALDFANYASKDYVILGGDIDLNGITLPASSETAPSAVTFDGRGFSIKNANVTADNSGLFGKSVGKSGFANWSVIANVALINAKATNDTAGILAYDSKFIIVANTYVQIAADSNKNGLSATNTNGASLSFHNTVIDDLRAEDASNMVISGNFGGGNNTMTYTRPLILITSNKTAGNYTDSNLVYKFASYSALATGFETVSANTNADFTTTGLWDLTDGMPIWAREADAIKSARSTVTVSDGVNNYEFGSVLNNSSTYEITGLVDYLGNDLLEGGDASFEFSAEPNDEGRFTFNANTFAVNELPPSGIPYSYDITVTILVDGDIVATVVIPVVVEYTIEVEELSGTYYYSITDKKLHADFASDITELYYEDDLGVKHQLTYNTTDGIPAITSVTTAKDGNYVYGFKSIDVALNETGEGVTAYSNTITLNRDVDGTNYIVEAMNFLAKTATGGYTFKVIPATQVVMTAEDVGYTDTAPEGFVNKLDITKYAANSYVVLGSHIDLDGYTIPASSGDGLAGVVFDGRGYTISNPTINGNGSQAGLFGRKGGPGTSLDDWMVISNVAILNAKTVGENDGIIFYTWGYTLLANVYVEISADSGINGLAAATLENIAFNAGDTLIVDHRAESADNTVISKTIQQANSFMYTRMVVVVSNNCIGKNGATIYDANSMGATTIGTPTGMGYGVYRYTTLDSLAENLASSNVLSWKSATAFHTPFDSVVWDTTSGTPVWKNMPVVA